MKKIIPSDVSVALRRRPGSTVLLINAGAVDVYVDSDYNRLISTPPGVAPDATPILAGTTMTWFQYPPSGVLWFRAAQQTSLEVQP